ncbi:hypothetical protein HNR42_000962 [Deinobacterium chartae]|uniref:Zinc ribbon domain-containing protein n=1 Tax=Deinobacterium chartae TaxID=521158 RepID=A0A841I0P4_9DEIO|nr:hypothetical protein [Deinobacterium chartae]MBB6097545.1 hypothetical protein [Deinobacterium chartae]
MQQFLNEQTQAIRSALEGLNPIPRGLWELMRSPVFWLSLWVGFNVAAARLFFGRVLGPVIGLGWACWVWASVLPGSLPEVLLTLGVLLGGTLLLRWGLVSPAGLALRGLRRCPECAEPVRRAARRCRYCGSDLEERRIFR